MPYNIALDIGEHQARLAVRGRGVALRQSSAAAVRRGEATPLALGNEALQYAGRLEPRITVGYPMHGGGVADEALLSHWLRDMIQTATSSGLVNRVRAIILCDPNAQPFTVKHLAEMAIDCGATASAVMPSDLCAALGAGLDVKAAKASLVADIGAGKVSVSLITLGRIAARESLPYGLRSMDESIVRLMRVKYGLIISNKAAEDVKLSLAMAVGGGAELKFAVTGMKPLTGFPASIEVSGAEIYELSAPLVQAISVLASSVVDRAPVELSADLNDRGIVLTGGGAQLYGLDKLIAEKTGLSCRVADDPSGCAILGASRMLEKPELYEDLIETHKFALEKRLVAPIRV